MWAGSSGSARRQVKRNNQKKAAGRGKAVFFIFPTHRMGTYWQADFEIKDVLNTSRFRQHQLHAVKNHPKKKIYLEVIFLSYQAGLS